MEKRDFKGVWIPKEIWLSPKLTLQEKVFLVEIDSLDSSERGCYAGNRYFAKFFGLSEDRCSAIITSLKKKLMVDVDINKASGKSIRKITSLMLIPTRRKDRVGIGENAEWPLGENAAPNNTEENNTVNSSPSGREVGEMISLFELVNPSFQALFKRKHEREAVAWLLEKYGEEKCRAMIQALPQIINQPYAPRVTTPEQLKNNLGKLIAFYNQEKGKQNKNLVITI